MSDVLRRPHSAPPAGHHDDVAGKGLPGHLDSPGPDSEVLVLPASRLHSGPRQGQGSSSFEAALTRSGCTPVEKHLQAAAGQLAGRSAVNTYEGGHSGPASGWSGHCQWT